ncbi:hypothetical protein B0H11DRAFT_1979367 [Mycena galericulata]|nr:hypothetical protein B0H11DRAFT_1979367 [Mycena galericulata]
MPGKRRKQESETSDMVSSFSDFLNADLGRLPSPQEAKMIHDIVEDKTAHLAVLNSRVPRRNTRKKTPPKLRAEIDLTRRFIKFHRALVAPWRRVPTEIMSEIFVLTLSPAPVHTVIGWDDDRAGTLLLCKICRIWRHIAISTPALWAVLSIPLLQRDVQRSLDWVPLWLNRSRSLPIYIQVQWDASTANSELDLVLSSVLSHLHHIRMLVIYGLDPSNLITGPSYPRPTFAPTQSIEAPVLATLDASLPFGSDYDWIFAACRAAPFLASLYTNQFFPGRFPVSQLARLYIGEPVHITDVFQLLGDAPSLQDVAVDVGGHPSNSAMGHILTARALSKLEITSNDHLGYFLDHIDLPALTEIQINRIDSWPQEEFTAFLSRSSCVLKRLVFAEVNISDAEGTSCVRHKSCQALETLVLWDCPPWHKTDEVLRYLTYRTAPFPNTRLQEIELEPLRVTDGLLADFAESRILPLIGLPPDVPEPGRLARLYLSMEDMRYSNPKDCERIQVLEGKCEILWSED